MSRSKWGERARSSICAILSPARDLTQQTRAARFWASGGFASLKIGWLRVRRAGKTTYFSSSIIRKYEILIPSSLLLSLPFISVSLSRPHSSSRAGLLLVCFCRRASFLFSALCAHTEEWEIEKTARRCWKRNLRSPVGNERGTICLFARGMQFFIRIRMNLLWIEARPPAPLESFIARNSCYVREFFFLFFFCLKIRFSMLFEARVKWRFILCGAI